MGLHYIDSQPAAIGAIEAMNLALKPKTAAENSYRNSCSYKAGGRVCKGAGDDWCFAAWCTAGCMTQTKWACLVLFGDVQYVIGTRWGRTVCHLTLGFLLFVSRFLVI